MIISPFEFLIPASNAAVCPKFFLNFIILTLGFKFESLFKTFKLLSFELSSTNKIS